MQEVYFARSAQLHVNDDVVQFSKSRLDFLCDLFPDISATIPQLVRWVELLTRPGDILSCLTMSLNCSSSDPRDHVFAITSLLDPQIRNMISIDYRATSQQALSNAVMACVAHCGDLDILCYAKLAADADFTTATSFGIEDLRIFLA
jgi:hypothetical protein